jgi:hypothetical protein
MNVQMHENIPVFVLDKVYDWENLDHRKKIFTRFVRSCDSYAFSSLFMKNVNFKKNHYGKLRIYSTHMFIEFTINFQSEKLVAPVKVRKELILNQAMRPEFPYALLSKVHFQEHDPVVDFKKIQKIMHRRGTMNLDDAQLVVAINHYYY